MKGIVVNFKLKLGSVMSSGSVLFDSWDDKKKIKIT